MRDDDLDQQEENNLVDEVDKVEIEVDEEAPTIPSRGRKTGSKKNAAGTPKKKRKEKKAAVERNHFPLDPRLNPSEHLFMRGLTDLVISSRAAKQSKGSLFVTYMRMKTAMEAVIFVYEAFNLWSCMFVSSIEWPKLAPTNIFLYGSAKSLDMYKLLGERVGFYAILSLFFLAALCMLVKDATVGSRAMQRHNIALRNRLVTSHTWREFFFGPKSGRSSKSRRFTGREWRFHLTVFAQYVFFELLFMPGLSIALVILNCQAARLDPSDSNSKRIYVFQPLVSGSGAENRKLCWEDGHGIDSFVGVFMAVVIYSCAIYHKRQKMRKASTVVFSLFFEIFYSMIKAALTVIAVCFPAAMDTALLLWGCLAAFSFLSVVNHKVQPCKGYGTVINAYRASTFAVGIITSILAVLVNEFFKSQETKNIAAAIWIALLFPVIGFAYQYCMLSASMMSGDVPQDKTIADLLKSHASEGNSKGLVGGLNVQRIAGSCVARLYHIDPQAKDVAILSQLMLYESTRSKLGLSNLHHGLSGVFGFFAPSEVGKQTALTVSHVSREKVTLLQDLDSRSGVRRKITASQGQVLGLHVVQNPYVESLVVNASRMLYPIPVKDIKEGRVSNLRWMDASRGESEILTKLFDYVYSNFSTAQLPTTVEFTKSPVRIARLESDFNMDSEADPSSPTRKEEMIPSVTIDVQSMLDTLDGDLDSMPMGFALDLSKHYLTSADMVLIMYLLKQNRNILALDLSDNMLDASSLPLIAEKFEKHPNLDCRMRDLYLHGNPLSLERKHDWLSGKEETVENWEELFALGHTLVRYAKHLRKIKVEAAEEINLEEAPTATKLKLGGCEHDLEKRIGDETAVMLAALLPKFGSLYELDLSKNNIGDKGCIYLATRALFADFVDEQMHSGSQCRISSLDLSENRIRDEGLVSLATMLKRNEFLNKLDLSRNKFSSTGLQFLSKGLVKSKYSHLQELYLEDNGQLGTGATDPLFEVLSRKDASGADCCILKTLSLSGVKLYSSGAVRVGKMLSVNRTLENLLLSGCELDQLPPETERMIISSGKRMYRDDSGLIEICKSMALNSGLRLLDISSNHLVTQEFMAIIIYVRANPSTALEHLKVHDNNIGISMAQFRPLIIEQVLTNPTLRRIDLHSNPVETGVTRELSELMSRKRPSVLTFA